jgi:hypothetical protein
VTLKELLDAIWNSIQDGCQCPNHRTGWEYYEANEFEYDCLIPHEGEKYE